jgi:hypothetical protein
MFFSKYNTMLISSESYVTKRQSIKLLGEILLDRANYSVMTQYVDSGEHLKIIMKLLRDDRRMINYEGFHVFKVRPQISDPSLYRPMLTAPGLRRQPQQVDSGAAHPDQQPREAAALSAQLPRRPHRGRAVHRREELPDTADRAAAQPAHSAACRGVGFCSSVGGLFSDKPFSNLSRAGGVHGMAFLLGRGLEATVLHGLAGAVTRRLSYYLVFAIWRGGGLD